MGNFISSSWNNLTYNVTNQLVSLGVKEASGVFNSNNYYNTSDGWHFYSKAAFTNRLVEVARVSATQVLAASVSNAYPAYKKYVENIATKKAIERNNGQYETLIQNQQVVNKNGYAELTLPDGNVIHAINKYGSICDDAIILAIPVERDVSYSIKSMSTQTGIQSTTEEFTTKNVFWYDMGPIISLNSGKNVILTKVQGRDYSRKELVSGGDLKFTISGRIVSGYPDVYPSAEVQKFKEIMLYNGIIQVDNILLRQFDVNKVIVTDFNCSQEQGFKDTQPYSFNCVAVEPDENTQISEDTISTVNQTFAESDTSGWLKTLLKNKLEELKTSAASQASTSLIGAMQNI